MVEKSLSTSESTTKPGEGEDKLIERFQNKEFLELITKIINILPHPPNIELIELEDPLPTPGGRSHNE